MRQVFAVLMALALPVAAQETQPVKQADSPLVAASKRANRKGKKATNVITNDMIRQAATGVAPRVTTTSAQAPMPWIPPAKATPEMESITARDTERRRLAELEATRKKTEEKKARLELMRSAAAEGELYHDAELDPDELVIATEAVETAAQQKPPRD